MWISKAEYDESGPGIVHMKCFWISGAVYLLLVFSVNWDARLSHGFYSILGSFWIIEGLLAMEHCERW